MELTGRVTGDAVIKTLPDERPVINFSIAINDYVKPKGTAEGKEYTLYVACSFWKGTAVAAKLVKGTVAELSGRLYIRAYAGTEGEPKASLHLHCNSIKVHGKTAKKEAGDNKPIQENAAIENIAAITEPMEDMPF